MLSVDKATIALQPTGVLRPYSSQYLQDWGALATMDLAVVDDSSSRGRQHQEPETLPCTVIAAPGSRLSFSWGTGCQLHLAEVACPSTGAGGVQPTAVTCEWTSMSSQQRRIAYQVMPLYSELQRNLIFARDGVPELASQARQEYSSAVMDVLTGSCSVLAAGGPANDDDLQIGYEAGLWQLLDLFFLHHDDLQHGAFPEAFALWMLQHGAMLDSETPGFSQLHAIAQELLQDPRVDTNPAYWNTVHRLVLRGQVELAASLLAHHPVMVAGQEDGMADMARGFEAVYQMLREVPRLGSREPEDASLMQRRGGAFTTDIVAFQHRREQWEKGVEELNIHREQLLSELKEADHAAYKGLAALLLVLRKEPTTMQPTSSFACKQMARVAWNWVELFTGMLLWQQRELVELRAFAQLAKVAKLMQRQPRSTDMEFLDFFEQAFEAICDLEVQKVVLLCTTGKYTSLQFVAHSFEVMRGSQDAARLIAQPLPHLGCDQAESFMLNYAEVLLGGGSTWVLGAECLAWCPVYGADTLEAALDRSLYVLVDQQAAHQALAMARRHDLTAAAYNLAKRLSAAASQSGQMAAALQWALQAQDPQLCAELVAPLFVMIQQQLLQQAGILQAAPLDVPELHDLEPLLLNLPDSSADAQGDTEQQQQQPRTQRYPELHFLRAMLQLQQALQRVHSCQQPIPAQDQDHVSNGALLGDVPQQQVALLQAAYADLRQPVQELLLDGLAPAALRLPLLVLIAPLLESPHTPFTRADVQQLMRVMQSVNSGLPAVAAAVLDGSSMPGVSWPVKLSDPVGPKASAVNAARLALFRGLARADVTEHSSVQAW